MRAAVTALAMLVLLPPVAHAAPLLVAVVPDLPGPAEGDEGFAVAAPARHDLSGWSVTDGESTWAFPAGTVLQAGVPLWVVGNASAWLAHDGPGPFLHAGASALRLGNEADGLRLLDPAGGEADAVAYGDGAGGAGDGAGFDPPASPGLVLQRRAGGDGSDWVDTDAPDDWRTPRLHRIGESALPRPAFTVQGLTLYASPDSSFAVLTGLVAGARERLHLHVYELRSAALADALVAAKQAHPALDLQVLVDGNPVGMDSADRHATADALRRVVAAGGRAVLAGNGRYDDHHLKVLVADDAVAVQSENWVPSGVPEDPTWGNRGWGVVAQGAELAEWFAAWMKADRDAWDSAPFDLQAYDPGFEPPPRSVPRSGSHVPRSPLTLQGSFRVTPLVSPDHTQDPAQDPAAAVAAAARTRLWAQQLDVALAGRNALGWAGPDPLAAALAGAAAAGAAVRVQAAQPFAAGDTGNAEAVAWLEERGVRARLFDRPGLGTLHNKGLVADGAVVVGSTNGNLHSRAQNREVALLVESPEAADYFAALAEDDWRGGGSPRDWSVPARDLRGMPGAPWPILLATLAVACAVARRWS